jgi:rubrerythrin
MELTTIESVLDFAIEREQQAVDFYTSLAGRMESPLLKGFFQTLSAQELAHRKLLENIRFKGTAFRGSSIAVKHAKDDCSPNQELAVEGALEVAIRREKNATTLYSQLAEQATDPDAKKILLDLAEQEATHELQIQEVLNASAAK